MKHDKSPSDLQDILNAFAFIESRASSDFSCMHPMSKNEFIKIYGSEIMDAAFKYYEKQYENAREKFQNDKKKG